MLLQEFLFPILILQFFFGLGDGNSWRFYIPTKSQEVRRVIFNFNKQDIFSRKTLIDKCMNPEEEVDVFCVAGGSIVFLQNDLSYEGFSPTSFLNSCVNLHSVFRIKSKKAFERVDNCAARESIFAIQKEIESLDLGDPKYEELKKRLDLAYNLLVKDVLLTQ